MSKIDHKHDTIKYLMAGLNQHMELNNQRLKTENDRMRKTLNELRAKRGEPPLKALVTVGGVDEKGEYTEEIIEADKADVDAWNNILTGDASMRIISEDNENG